MTIKDPPAGRLPETSMRDLLRRLERESNANHPARPSAPPPEPPSIYANTAAPNTPQQALRSTETNEQRSLVVGGWVLREDPLSGDLTAIDPDGNPHTLASRGGA